MNKIFIIVLGLCLFSSPLPAQAKKDSLWKVWNDPAEADTNRLKAMQALMWPMLNIDLDSACLLANVQLNFAKKKKNKKWMAKALYNMATCYYWKSDYAQSLDLYNQSLELRKELKDLKGEAAIYGNIGLIYGAQGNHLKDLEYQLKSLSINERINDTANLTSNYNNLATIYQKEGDSTKAFEYYNAALKMYHAEKDQRSIALIYNNIGSLYRSFEQYEKALEYLNRSLSIRKELQDKLGMAINYINLGTVYTQMGEYEKAKENTILSIEHFKSLGDTSSFANGYFTLGDIAFKEKKYQEAVRWCRQSLAIAKAANKLEIERAGCHCLYEAHKSLGNLAEALDYFERYVMLNDSLKEEELRIEMSRLEFEKEIFTDSLAREEEKNILHLTHQSELAKRNRATNIIIFIAFGVLILALIFLNRMLTFRHKSEILKLKTEELEKQQLVNEIDLLKTQVNPHFLFNSLSILSSLVHVDPDLSERFIEQLSRSYRYILEQKDQSLVTLRTELGFIEAYAFLLKIRFENKFDLRINLPEDMLDKYKIAPLTLQLLVENAVKHNRMSVNEPLIVTISLEDKDILTVKNKLQPRSTQVNSTGMGLQNIMNRYALLTKRKAWAGESEDSFVVKIPLLNEIA